jgi:hypothetical protein
MTEQRSPDPSGPEADRPVRPLPLSYRAPQTEIREAWEGSISPFSKIFVVVLLIALFGGSLLAIVLLFMALFT